MMSDLGRIIDQISRDKGIDRQLLVEGLEEAVMSAAKKRFGYRRDLEVRFNDELGEIELFQFRTVVEEVADEQTEISLKEAQVLDPEVELGDDIGSKMDDVADLGRIAAQSAKQVIIQKMKDAESDVIYDMYKDRKGEIINGIVQRFERGNIIVNLGRTDAILPASQQMPRRSYRQGDRVRAMLIEVRKSTRDAQLVLSRTDNDFLSELFRLEVPEISEDIVTIMGVCREPGSRAKIAVSSSESDVDPVGACVGMKGSRVQNVVQELQGEKIDIVPWSPDPARFVSNALAPAQVSLVVVDEDNKTLLVVAPDDQLSLAIGRQGQNVRLASILLGWRIDVKSESRYANFSQDGYQELLTVNGIDEKRADKFFEAGIDSLALFTETGADTIAEIIGVEEAEAAMLLAAAVPALQKVNENKAAAAEDTVAEEEEASEVADAAEDTVAEEEEASEVADAAEDIVAEGQEEASDAAETDPEVGEGAAEED